MRVKVRMEKVANPLEYEADGTYEKGAFYCIRLGEDVVKIPLTNIFMVVETYGYHSPKGNTALEVDVRGSALGDIARIVREELIKLQRRRGMT